MEENDNFASPYLVGGEITTQLENENMQKACPDFFKVKLDNPLGEKDIDEVNSNLNRTMLDSICLLLRNSVF